ncbi:MAG: adenylate/guanylate cyclase domain-containing protein [Alphaproteobacteria bacterium]|nr:adenylate/guanylate cyclase domain-containing protein [Alphaproteobacteria bacterium]
MADDAKTKIIPKKPRKWGLKALSGSGRPVAFVMLLGLLWAMHSDPAPFEFVRLKTFDFFQAQKPRELPEQKLVGIIDLDDESLATIGQWPWPRTTVARLIDRLFEMGAVVVGFDIVFAEPDRMSPKKVAESMSGLDPAIKSRLMNMKSNDQVLAESIARAGRVVVGQSVIDSQEYGEQGERPVTSVAQIGDPSPFLFSFPGMVRNLVMFDQVAAGRGVFNVLSEMDGVTRRVPAVENVNGELHPALSIEMLRVATGETSLLIRVKSDKTGIQDLVLQKQRAVIPTDGMGRIWVNFSKWDKDKYIPAKQVLDGTVDPARIRNKLLLVGTSAVGLLDIKTTPVEARLPGVEVHANILENIFSNQFLVRPPNALGQEVLFTAGMGLLLILFLPIIGARWTMAFFILSASSVAGYSWYQFTSINHLYDPSIPILILLVIYIELTYANFASEEKKRRQVRDAFSRYLSPAQVEKLAADPGKLTLGGEIKDMTLLFCDVRGFTTISEQFDAQGLTRLINRFLTPMTDVILAHQGTIDKYMGDCIMAFWNAPEDDAQHASHACESALIMKERLVVLNDDLEAESKVENRKHIPINIGIGLNSGNVCVGNMGSDQRFDYSVLGDNVNLASRLEGQSKTYGVTCVIGENTYTEAPDYACLELDLIKVKGKTEAVRIFTLLGRPEMRKDSRFTALEVEHKAMLAAYRAQKWDEALALLAKCRELGAWLHLDHLYDLYEERIADYRENSPGADWDGVYVAKSK